MRHISPTASTRFPFPDSRFTINGIPFASTSTSTRWGVLIVRSRSVFNPQSAIDSWLIVNQRIPPLREPRPWLHLDDVIEQRSLEPELDLPGGGAERATPVGTRGGARVASLPASRDAYRRPGDQAQAQ